MHVLLLTFALGSRALPGLAVVDRPSFQPAALVAPVTMVLMNQTNPPAQPPQINVEVNRGGGRAWYLSPVWMAIGGVALVVVILLIVMAARGGGSGGTTVVRG